MSGLSMSPIAKSSVLPFLRAQRGGALLEAIVATGLLAGVLTMALQGLATGSRALNTIDYLTTAQNIARSQMEFALDSAYCAPPCTYPAIPAPAGYTVTAQAQAYPGGDANLEYLVVTVSKDGQIVVQTKRLRVNR